MNLPLVKEHILFREVLIDNICEYFLSLIFSYRISLFWRVKDVQTWRLSEKLAWHFYDYFEPNNIGSWLPELSRTVKP